jgi:hypothetical protein
MSDFVAAVLCLPFIIAPLVILVMIVANNIQASYLTPCHIQRFVENILF